MPYVYDACTFVMLSEFLKSHCLSSWFVPRHRVLIPLLINLLSTMVYTNAAISPNMTGIKDKKSHPYHRQKMRIMMKVMIMIIIRIFFEGGTSDPPDECGI